ncbi:MAG TPA: hypothetical protein PK830_01915 [Candidatus Atribacteria bacterium]|nr:hypothetical protein [Candidatus Atribacteria bacterium]HPT77848.1 hypothetical protein [Candidatus Atribacteria bacterium]
MGYGFAGRGNNDDSLLFFFLLLIILFSNCRFFRDGSELLFFFLLLVVLFNSNNVCGSIGSGSNRNC